MAPKDRRKSDRQDKQDRTDDSLLQPTLLVTVKVPPKKLRAIFDSSSLPDTTAKEESPAKESPAGSTPLPAPATSNGDNASDSTPNTPAASGTPAPSSSMGPPVDGPKKKGVKRSAAGANGGNSDPLAKVRGKPGPKKKQRLDDGTLDPSRSGGLGASHKLGPKANQGAINAGLRALDRSGKPCRKWAKGNFQLKSFTGVAWEIPRWTAPPKPAAPEENPIEDSNSASVEGSNKENKNNDQVKSDNSNSGGDVEMQSAPSIPASSPAPAPAPVSDPVPIPAAS